MRARQRHFNPRFAGANLVLDSRFINQSDGSAVSTWSDRSGNGYDATQGSASSQPTFRTNQQGGNGGVDFDGANDFITGTYNPTGVPRTVHITFKADTTSALSTLLQIPIRPNPNGWLARWGSLTGTWYISGDINATNQTIPTQSNGTSAIIGSWSSDSSRNVSFVRDGSSQTVTGNAPNTVSSPTQIDGYSLGRVRSQNDTFVGQYCNGNVFSLHIWGGQQINGALRKRCEHASAFSFKITCS